MTDEEEYLISYANLKSGLFTYQNDFLDHKSLKKFYNSSYMGVPICLPKGIKFFDYSKANYFKIDKPVFSKKIFRTNQLGYIGNKKFFRYGNLFASNVFLKKKYSIARLEYPLYKYRIHESNSTHNLKNIKHYNKLLKNKKTSKK